MSKYKLIAFDMDGTLLNSKKEISNENLKMINKAFDEGYEVVLSTGRGIAELKQYFEQMPKLRYLICVSGAMVYDIKNKETIYENALSVETVKHILKIKKEDKIMIQMLTTDSVLERKHFEILEEFQVAPYRALYENTAILVDSIDEYFDTYNKPVAKINLFHIDEESRERTLKKLEPLGIESVYSEKTSIENSAIGITKGKGLMILCEHLNIDISQTIAVGDSENDIDILKTAGLAIAMGNANENVKNISDVIVNDCDHDGCAQAIIEYLIKN